MNVLGKCIKIRHVVKLRQIARKWRKLASARNISKILASKLLSSLSCEVSYVSHDKQVNGKKSNDAHRLSGSVLATPPDVPLGHLAVYVGQQCRRRFVIRAAYLNHPVFRALLEQAEEEFVYANQRGLTIPCDEFLFEHILGLFSGNDHATIGRLDLEAIKSNFFNEWYCLPEVPKGILLGKESRPLLHGLAGRSIS